MSVSMGSACCVHAKDRSVILPKRIRGESSDRNVTCSPSWSFRWDNRRRVAGETEDLSYHVSHGVSRNVRTEIKGPLGSERGNFSDGGSPLQNFGTPASQKSPFHYTMSTNMMTPQSDLSMASNYSTEAKNSLESPEVADLSVPRLTFSIPSSFSTGIADPLPGCSHMLPPNSTPSRRPRRSPGHQLLRQVSDSQILGFKSPNNFSISEGRSSFILPACNNDSTTGSNGGFSDGWSVRTFSELVASSQRGRWSFDSESCGKISEHSSRFVYSPTVDLQTCGACSKLLLERTSWSSHELPVAAVLVCGHVYHAECLETMTVEGDKYDPTCPICVIGEKEFSRMSRKALRAEAELSARTHKISRNRVVDSYVDGEFDDICQNSSKQKGKALMMEPSSSTKGSLAKPFFRRHFSFGSKWSRSLSDNDCARKKGFWARYRKD